MGPNDRKFRYAEARLLGFNKRKSAQAAGCRFAIAHAQAYRWERDPEVIAYMQAGLERRQRRFRVTEKRIKEEMALAAFSDIRDFLRVDAKGGVRLDPKRLLRREARAISQVKFKEGKLDIKFHSKDRSLRDLWEFMGFGLIPQNEGGEEGGEADSPEDNEPQVILYLPDNGRGKKKD